MHSEYAIGGPIEGDAPVPRFDNSYVVPAEQLRAIGYDPDQLKRINDGFPTADLIEKHIVDSIESVIEDISNAFHFPDDFATQVRATLQPYIRPTAEALSASLVNDESAEQFEARMAAIKIEEP